MKILLVAVNAKYIHSNLAVYSLRAFADKYADNIKITERTINHSEEEILKAIYNEKAEVVAFSCYIWNIEVIKQITSELKKVQPKVIIWYGGPEVSYDAKKCLLENQGLDGVMIGEGEQTFLELVRYYVEGNIRLEDINGLAYKISAEGIEKHCLEGIQSDSSFDLQNEDRITITPTRLPLSLDVIPFPYKDIKEFKNRIIYYESSRGCPYSCSYCLSSIDKQVRLRNTDLVKKELVFLLERHVPQVKFVDRTFNCNKSHAMDIWRFIKENDNGITNFHFEISADLLSEEELELLASLRPGQVQLEIGVQSTNQDTISTINRRMDLSKLKSNVARIKEGKNIHQHLDLIAGLPMEDYDSFESSFNDVYRMKPDQLQLGFLKILKGSLMETESATYGIVYRNKPPYEVLYTKHLDYNNILKIKSICEMVEIYYNSAQFTYSICFLEHFYDSPIKLYQKLSDYYDRKDLSSIAHNRVKRYEVLLQFYQETVSEQVLREDPDLLDLFKELLILDLFLREDLKARPNFAPAKPLHNGLQELYKKYGATGKSIHIERFTFDIIASALSGKAIKKETLLLFDYNNRDILNKAANITRIV